MVFRFAHINWLTDDVFHFRIIHPFIVIIVITFGYIYLYIYTITIYMNVFLYASKFSMFYYWQNGPAAATAAAAAIKSNFCKRIKWRPAFMHTSSYVIPFFSSSFFSVWIFEFIRSESLLLLHFFLMIVFRINSQLFAARKSDIVDCDGIHMHVLYGLYYTVYTHTHSVPLRCREYKLQYILFLCQRR